MTICKCSTLYKDQLQLSPAQAAHARLVWQVYVLRDMLLQVAQLQLFVTACNRLSTG